MASIQYEFEDMEINDSMIMSFLEESSLDDHIGEDEEQLNRVMRSLEAEINTSSIDVRAQDYPNMEETDRSQRGTQVEGYGFPESRDLDDFGLVDLDTMLSLQSDDDIMSWYSVSYMDGADNVHEIGGFDGYAHHQMNFEVAFEEQQFCYELWQENNDVIVV